MSDSPYQHTPSDTLAWVPAIDLEADMCARCEVQFGPGRSAKDDDTLVEEVVDGKDKWTHCSINQRDAAEVV
jgi:hypothetical protein